MALEELIDWPFLANNQTESAERTGAPPPGVSDLRPAL
jgi:hypothetical protein